LFDPYRDPVQVPHFRSRFGGLWTDLDSAPELVEGKRELGMISEEEAQQLLFFVENGYLVLKNAVDAKLVDKLNDDVDKLAEDPPPEAWISCSENGRSVGRQMVPGDRDEANKTVKLLDIYDYLPSARRVAFAPRTMGFVKLVFERPVLAHQSLFFFKGTQQEIHQDTAFVRISSPMELVASWTALEDIQPGSGELVYYPKSHQFPEFLFGGESKWLFPGCNDLGSYYEHLDNCAKSRKIPKTKFLANKGDVLIWSADLAHGGSEIDDPAKTRRSIAVHYCPFNTYPMYRQYVGASEVVKAGDGLYYCSEKKTPWF